MATVAFGLAGALIGGAVGGPKGAQLGWAAGTLIGTALFPPKQEPQSRGRLDDLKVTGSGYGAPIPLIFGDMRAGGNILWSIDLEEHVRKKKQGAKSTARATVKKYHYTVDMLLSVCRGPIGEVRRIWAEDRLIYDITTFPTIEPDFITIFLGEEDQQPWSIIEAVEGVGNVPAYRGQCCIGFNNWNLEPYGNRIPAVTVEVGPVANSPTALFWLDAVTISGLADSDPVTNWTDRTGNSFHAINSSGSNRPIIKKNIKAGRQVVRGASGNWLEIASMTTQAASNWSFYVVCNPTDIVTNDGWVFRSDGSQLTFYNSDDTGGGGDFVGYNDGSFQDVAAPTTGWQILSWHLNQESNQGKVYRNESLLGTGTYGTKKSIETPGIFNQGGGGAGTSFIGDIAEVIMFQGVHDDDQRQDVLDYLNDKWVVY